MPYKKVGKDKYTHAGKTYHLDQIRAIEANKHKSHRAVKALKKHKS